MSANTQSIRAFLNCYQDSQKREDVFRNGMFSQGWVARIEAFDVAKQTRLGVFGIPLDPSEVLLQVYQTLSLGSVQFPLAISPTGQKFVILRTLYTIVKGDSTWGYTSVVLPLDECRANHNFWLLPKKGARGYSLDQYHRLGKQKEFERVCLYWLYFNDTGDHVCLVEQVRSSPVCVSVFDVTQNTIRPLLIAQRSKWLRQFDCPYPTRDEKEFELAFHPSLPIIALAGYMGVYIWDYKSGMSSHLSTDFLLTNSLAASNDSFVKVTAAAEDITYFSFTADGRSFVVNLGPRGETRPEVFNVPESFLAGSYQLVCVQNGNGMNESQRDTEDALTASTRNNEQTLTPSYPGTIGALTPHLHTVLSGSQQIVVRGKKVAEVTVANTNNTATLSLKATNSSAGDTVTLTRIPNWLGSSHVQPSIVLPDKPRAPVRVVLDKGIETWNQLAQASSETNSSGSQFPLVLERDVRSFGKTSGEPRLSNIMIGRDDKQRQTEGVRKPTSHPPRLSEQGEVSLLSSGSQREDLSDIGPVRPTVVEPEDVQIIKPTGIPVDQSDLDSDSTSPFDYGDTTLPMSRNAGPDSTGPGQEPGLAPPLESTSSISTDAQMSSDGQRPEKKSWRERRKRFFGKVKSISIGSSTSTL